MGNFKKEKNAYYLEMISIVSIDNSKESSVKHLEKRLEFRTIVGLTSKTQL